VRQGGNGALLWPVGVTSIEEVPWDLAEAVNQAQRILDWYESSLEEDIPPQHLWPFSAEVSDWFAGVRIRKRREREDMNDPDLASGMTENDDPRIRKLKER
jgi:hypothetical protein